MKYLARILFALSLAILGHVTDATAAGNANSITAMPTVAQIRAANWSYLTTLQTTGYYSAGDGGGGVTYTYAGTTSCTDDGGATLKDGGGNCFYADRFPENIRQWGALSDAPLTGTSVGTVDSGPIIQNALTACALATLPGGQTKGVGCTLRFPYGPTSTNSTYATSLCFDVRNVQGINLVGDGQGNTTIKYTGAGCGATNPAVFTYGFKQGNTAGSISSGSISGISINANGLAASALALSGLQKGQFKDVGLYNATSSCLLVEDSNAGSSSGQTLQNNFNGLTIDCSFRNRYFAGTIPTLAAFGVDLGNSRSNKCISPASCYFEKTQTQTGSTAGTTITLATAVGNFSTGTIVTDTNGAVPAGTYVTACFDTNGAPNSDCTSIKSVTVNNSVSTSSGDTFTFYSGPVNAVRNNEFRNCSILTEDIGAGIRAGYGNGDIFDCVIKRHADAAIDTTGATGTSGTTQLTFPAGFLNPGSTNAIVTDGAGSFPANTYIVSIAGGNVATLSANMTANVLATVTGTAASSSGTTLNLTAPVTIVPGMSVVDTTTGTSIAPNMTVVSCSGGTGAGNCTGASIVTITAPGIITDPVGNTITFSDDVTVDGSTPITTLALSTSAYLWSDGSTSGLSAFLTLGAPISSLKIGDTVTDLTNSTRLPLGSTGNPDYVVGCADNSLAPTSCAVATKIQLAYPPTTGGVTDLVQFGTLGYSIDLLGTPIGTGNTGPAWHEFFFGSQTGPARVRSENLYRAPMSYSFPNGAIAENNVLDIQNSDNGGFNGVIVTDPGAYLLMCHDTGDCSGKVIAGGIYMAGNPNLDRTFHSFSETLRSQFYQSLDLPAITAVGDTANPGIAVWDRAANDESTIGTDPNSGDLQLNTNVAGAAVAGVRVVSITECSPIATPQYRQCANSGTGNALIELSAGDIASTSLFKKQSVSVTGANGSVIGDANAACNANVTSGVKLLDATHFFLSSSSGHWQNASCAGGHIATCGTASVLGSCDALLWSGNMSIQPITSTSLDTGKVKYLIQSTAMLLAGTSTCTATGIAGTTSGNVETSTVFSVPDATHVILTVNSASESGTGGTIACVPTNAPSNTVANLGVAASNFGRNLSRTTVTQQTDGGSPPLVQLNFAGASDNGIKLATGQYVAISGSQAPFVNGVHPITVISSTLATIQDAAFVTGATYSQKVTVTWLDPAIKFGCAGNGTRPTPSALNSPQVSVELYCDAADGGGVKAITSGGAITLLTGGAIPTCTTCGTGGTLAATSSNIAGRITEGTTPGTTVVLTFAATDPFAHPPVCFAQDETTGAPMPVTTVTTAAVTFTYSGLTAADKVSYHCTAF